MTQERALEAGQDVRDEDLPPPNLQQRGAETA